VWRYAAVAAGVVLACSSAWLAWDNYILRGRLAAPATTGQEQQVAMVYPLYLPAGVTRGSGVGQGLRIPAGAGIVELQLEFSGGTAGSYSVELRTTGERTVATQRAEPPGAGAPLRVPVSAKLLAPGRYEVEVGTETDGVRRAVEFYYFSILGK
jgi:hypothetical protein